MGLPGCRIINISCIHLGTNFCKSFQLFGEELGGGDGVLGEFEDDSDEELTEVPAEEITSTMSAGDDNGLLDMNLPAHFRCASHRLNNVATTDVLAANDDFDFKRKSRNAHSKCTALLNKQGRSSQASDNVREVCGKLFERPNDTRWNSHHRAMNGIKEAIDKSDDNLNGLMDKLGLPWFTEENITFIQEYCEVFEPFATTLDILQREKNCFIGMLLPLLAHLEAELVSAAQKVDICQPLAQALLDGIAKRFDSEFTKDNFYIAAFLIPRFKDSWVFSSEKRDYIWGKIKAEVVKESGPSVPSVQRVVEKKKDPLDRLFPLGEMTQTADDYLEAYKSAPRGDVEQLTRYPPLDVLFRKYNSPLSSSASVERLFR